MKDLLKDFERLIRIDYDLKAEDEILVAVSGGLDSTVLVHLFRAIGQNIALVHINYHLREASSMSDEDFVRQLAITIGCPYHIYEARLEKSDSHIQEKARDIRYAHFHRLVSEHGYKYVATAHHLNDQLETFLINLTRGTGLDGLKGIPEKTDTFIRPLLHYSKQELQNYTEVENIDYRVDQSNFSDNYLRNRLRNTVIPLLLKENNRLLRNFHTTLEKIKDADHVYKNYVTQIQNNSVTVVDSTVEIHLEHISSWPLLFQIIKEYGFTYSQSKNIWGSIDKTGSQFISPNYISIIDRGKLLINTKIDHLMTALTIKDHESDTDLFNGYILKLEPAHEYTLDDNAHIEYMDADKITWPLTARWWEPGDRFDPLGLEGHNQKIQDYFTDHKISRFAKEKTRILEDNDGIIWLIGHRISQRVALSASTKSYLKAEIYKSHNTK